MAPLHENHPADDLLNSYCISSNQLNSIDQIEQRIVSDIDLVREVLREQKLALSRLEIVVSEDQYEKACAEYLKALNKNRYLMRQRLSELTGIDFEYLYQRSKDCGDD